MVCDARTKEVENLSKEWQKNVLKLFQNKKGPKNLRYPTKKQSFSKAFLSGNFFGPSYFEAALESSLTLLLTNHHVHNLMLEFSLLFCKINFLILNSLENSLQTKIVFQRSEIMQTAF